MKKDITVTFKVEQNARPIQATLDYLYGGYKVTEYFFSSESQKESTPASWVYEEDGDYYACSNCDYVPPKELITPYCPMCGRYLTNHDLLNAGGFDYE